MKTETTKEQWMSGSSSVNKINLSEIKKRKVIVKNKNLKLY